MRTKEEMAAYQKARREKLRGRVDPLDEAITSVKKLVVVDRGSLILYLLVWVVRRWR